MNTPNTILKKYWGFDDFRNPQKEIITSVLEGKDTLALLPTGGGKSICFQVPGIINEGICVVISPLIALMNDQVKNLQEKNIKAVALTSLMKQDDIIRAFDNLQFGNYKFLYLSPERLQSELIQQKIRQLDVQLIAIDEAHCISEWGHDFRPSYLKISILRELFPRTPVIALTASATKQVQEDIIKNLELESPKVFKKSFARENLAYQIFEVEDKLFRVEQILKKINGTKIIYTNSRRNTVEISNQLNSLGYNSCFYHGGMTTQDKLTNYEKWLSNEITIIVATNAFGMGIDKANVRAVIHFNLPQSIENYIQEAGRGGRDSKKAFAVLLKNKLDLENSQNQLAKSLPTIEFIKKVYFNLNQHFQIAYGEVSFENFKFNLTEFCLKYKLPIALAYNTIKVLEKENILFLDENIDRKTTVKFILSNNDVFNYFYSHNKSKEQLIKLLLRTYGGIFESPKNINLKYLSTSLKISLGNLHKQLLALEKDEVIEYENWNNTTQIQFLVAREDNKTINVVSKNIENRQQQKINKLKHLITFIKNEKDCRSKQLLTYFGETQKEDCQICDVCISKKNKSKKVDLKELSNQVLSILEKHQQLSSKEIVSLLNQSEQDILFCIKILLEKGIIGVTSQNKYTLK